jgi:L-cysteine desulfidase
MSDYTIRDVPRLEVASAPGCNEPVAVALPAAAAARWLGQVRTVLHTLKRYLYDHQ